jgi:hypothetical protein
MESQMIDGVEFVLDAAPVRQEPVTHQCVCLLHYERESGGKTTTVRDKCHEMVDSPDQAFCDECERDDHHLLHNQFGDARNLHRKGKNVE